jgi:hypothetical protein
MEQPLQFAEPCSKLAGTYAVYQILGWRRGGVCFTRARPCMASDFARNTLLTHSCQGYLRVAAADLKQIR